MTELVVRIEEYDRDIPGSHDPDDRWDAPDQQYTFEGVYVQVKRKMDQYSTHELDDVQRGDNIYVVTANYDSGSSFHRSYGHTALAGVHKNGVDAVNHLDRLRADENTDGYAAWSGYFERLNHFDMHVVRVD